MARSDHPSMRNPSQRRGAETAICGHDGCGLLISRRHPDSGGEPWAWVHDTDQADHPAQPIGVR